VYYLISTSTSETCANVKDVEPVFWFDKFSGKKISKRFPRVKVKLNKLVEVRDYFIAGDYRLMSTQMLSIIRSLGEQHIQEFPVELFAPRGKKDQGSHKVVHFLENVTCMNLEESTFTEDEDGFIDRIQRLVLDESKIPADRHLFRMEEQATFVLISERLKQEIETAKLTGMQIFRPDKIGDWFYG
jgi:hypothetical protein